MIDELRLARRSAGWSQRALAERAGVDAQTIKRLEQGVGSAATLVAVMNVLAFRLTGIGPGTSLPEQLKTRRIARSMSLADAASSAGLSRATVASLERGGGSVASLIRLLEAIAPRARRRAPERSYWGQGDKNDRDSRFTPPEFMESVYAAFGEVDIDPCGHALSPVVARRRILLSEGGDGLTEDWTGGLAFVNPPFSALLRWLRRSHDQWKAGNVSTVVCLVPVRTDSTLFHRTLSADADICLLHGRIRFLDPTGRRQPTPFSLMVMTFGATASQRARFAELVQGIWMSPSDSTRQPLGEGLIPTDSIPSAPA